MKRPGGGTMESDGNGGAYYHIGRGDMLKIGGVIAALWGLMQVAGWAGFTPVDVRAAEKRTVKIETKLTEIWDCQQKIVKALSEFRENNTTDHVMLRERLSAIEASVEVALEDVSSP